MTEENYISITETVDYINYLLGISIKVKEAHWKTESNSMHQQLDELYYRLTNMIDSLMEEVLAMTGRENLIKDEIQAFASIIVYTAPLDLFMLTIDKTVAFRTYIESLNNPDYTGLISQLDECITNLNILKYRAELV
jgi:hypothetical protein